MRATLRYTYGHCVSYAVGRHSLNANKSTDYKGSTPCEKVASAPKSAFFLAPLSPSIFNKINYTMKNLNQFSPKAQYITPSCKSVELQARDVILQGSIEPDYRSGENFGRQRDWLNGGEEWE